MRLLVITSSFPRHDRDFSGLFVEQWAKALAARGHDLDILCWRGPGATDGVVATGVKRHFIAYGPPRFESLFFGAGAPENIAAQPGRTLLAIPAAAAMIAAALKRLATGRFDAVVGHWLLPAGLIARLVGALSGHPTYVVGHSGGAHLLSRLPPALSRPLARYISAGPTTMPTGPLRDKLSAIAGRPADSIAVSPMGFSPPPSLPEPRDRRRTLGFLGRLVPIKNVPLLFDILPKFPDWNLAIAGQGPCRQPWESRAHASGASIRFLGPLYGAKKWDFLSRCDALVLPSTPRADGRHEGLPVSVLEAAYAGAIPLVSGVPGIAPWLADPDHQILPPNNPSQWSIALRWLADQSPSARQNLRQKTSRLVQPLRWPEYGAWWHQWLQNSS